MIGDRLKEERNRIGLTQPAFAEKAGAKKRTLIDWEKGVSSPTALQMQALAEAGADVQYIITGIRSNQTDSPALNREEEVLLDNYRHSPREAQLALKATSDALTQPHKTRLTR